MLTILKNRLFSKSGASDIMVVIVLIIVFSAFAFILFKPLSNESESIGTGINNRLDEAINEANNIINGSL